MKKIYLYQLNKDFKFFLSAFLIVITIGVIFGLLFLYDTTSFNKETTSERLIESQQLVEEDFGIDESKAKSNGELLMTTHNHIIGFGFIFFLIGGIFYFNSVISGFWKMLLIIEPLLSTIISFGSMWIVRYFGSEWIYLTIISAVLMYVSLFVMVAILLFELNLKSSA